MNADPINLMHIHFTTFYIRTYKWLMGIMHAQPENSPRPSSSLWGGQIRMSGLDTYHRQFSATPKDKYQDQ